MSVPVQCWPVVTTVSIDVFSPCTTNIKKERDPSRLYRRREPVTSLGVRLWNRVDDLEEGRRIGVAKPLRNGPLQHRRLAIRSADSFDLGLQGQALFLSDGSHLDHGFAAEDRPRGLCQQDGTDRCRIGQHEDTKSAWAIAYSDRMTTVMPRAWRGSAFVVVRLYRDGMADRLARIIHEASPASADTRL